MVAEAAVANREARFERHFLLFVASQGKKGKRESQGTSVETARTNYSFFDVSIPCDFGGGHHPSTGVLSACGMHPPSLSVSFGSQRKEREKGRVTPTARDATVRPKSKKFSRTIPPPSLLHGKICIGVRSSPILKCLKEAFCKVAKWHWRHPFLNTPFPFPPFPSFSAVPAFAW